MRRWITAVAGTGVLAATMAGVGGPAEARPRPTPTKEEHCVLVVVGREADGELRTDPMVCDDTPQAARAAAGEAAAADWAIGIHYDGAGYTGSSVTVVGSDCAGGWLNLPANWNDRISSTRNGCGTIRHFVHVNLTGSQQTTLSPGGNLTGSVNNEVSSIQYLP